jgi:hypothetical protein
LKELMMKRLTFLLALVMVIGVVGCQNRTEPMTAPTTQSADGHSHGPDEEGHSHDEDQHDHSIAGHSHGVGPHDGTIADWGGGKYHVEFVVNHDKKEATVYVLGSDEKTASPIDAPTVELSIKSPAMQVTLQPSPQESDPQGKASRYVGVHDQLAVVQEYEGTITGVVDGTPYSGDFKEEAHGDHAH